MILALPLAALLLTSPPPTDTVKPARAWTASVVHDWDFFRKSDPRWESWKTLTVGVQRKLSAGTLVLQGLRIERFGRLDAGGAGELYLPLSRRAYAAARVQVVPGAEVLPRTDASLELFQALAHGYEVSGAFRTMDYPEAPVRIYSAGLARYTGNFYLRTRWSTSRRAGASGWSGVATARQYHRAPLEFMEASAGAGLEPVTVAAGRLEMHQSRFLAFRVQGFLTPSFGLTSGAAWNHFQGVPDRTSASLGALLRW